MNWSKALGAWAVTQALSLAGRNLRVRSCRLSENGAVSWVPPGRFLVPGGPGAPERRCALGGSNKHRKSFAGSELVFCVVRVLR